MNAKQLDFDMLLSAARCMEREGGSFAGHIARAFYVADASNREKLLSAFDELFVEFYRKHMRDVRNQEMRVNG